MRDVGFVSLREQLNAVRARHAGCAPKLNRVFAPAILTTLLADARARECAVSRAIADLDLRIARARAEVVGLRADDMPAVQAACAKVQLDATLAHTAAATESILDVCEMLDGMADDLEGVRGTRTRELPYRLREATRRIYEACGFQDITGQRINRAAGSIRAIETCLARIVAILGADEVAGVAGCDPDPTVADETARLLDGPRSPVLAMAQDDIDRLLASSE